MKNNKKIAVIVIVNIIIIGIICSFINIKVNVVKEKQIIKEMSESTQVSNLQTQINTLNKEHTDYANYIQTCKNRIATALTNEKVATSGNDTLETMSANIGKVLQARTADATATESDIAEGKTAYVNGKLITGNTSKYNNISNELIPILTENNSQIIVSSEFNSEYGAYHAFNNCFQENHWRAKGDIEEAYIGYNFNKKVGISRFILIPPVSAATYEVRRLPKTFVVQKSEDGITWENVQFYTINNTTATLHSFEFNKPIITQYFRIYITSNNNNDNYHSIGYLQCYGEIL